MSTTRRQFTDELKRAAAGLPASRGQPLRQIARALGIAARHGLFASIEGYANRRRLRSALGYIAPGEAERQAAQSAVH